MDSLIWLALPILALYFLILRPTQTRRRRQAELIASLEPGISVITHSGLHGTIRAVDGDVVDVEVAPGIVTRWSTWGIGGVIPLPPSEESQTPSDT